MIPDTSKIWMHREKALLGGKVNGILISQLRKTTYVRSELKTKEKSEVESLSSLSNVEVNTFFSMTWASRSSAVSIISRVYPDLASLLAYEAI